MNTAKLKLILLAFLLTLGFIFRVYPGSNNLIWSYDQARDSVIIRSIFGEKNLILVGPQTEYVGLSHGPLYYYVLAPFYYFGQTNLTFPLLAMIGINISTVFPIWLLSRKLFFKKSVAFLSVLFFLFAYQQIEYARWLSNVSITLPLLAWFLYFTWTATTQYKAVFFAGLFLGLSIHGELFLLYLIPLTLLYLIANKVKPNYLLYFFLGLCTALSTFIIAEFRFEFLATKTFILTFLGDQSVSTKSLVTSVGGYLDHVGLTTYQTIGGLTPHTGLLVFICGLLFLAHLYRKGQLKSSNKPVCFLLLFLFSHSILFLFKYVDSVFLDLPIVIPLTILSGFLFDNLLRSKYKVAGFTLLVLMLCTQLYQLHSNTIHKTPMQLYKFHQGGILFSQKKEIVERMYELASGSTFTLGVLGTPYGVQTTWATIFEQVLAENQTFSRPHWYGFQALGYPYDSFFSKTDHPAKKHFVIIEENIITLAGIYVVEDYMRQLETSTRLISEETHYGFKLQVREKRE